MKNLCTVTVGLALGIALVSCAGQARKATPYEVSDARKDDIRDLWIQIRGWRVEAGMDPDPSTVLITSQVRIGMGSPRLRICPVNPRTEVCQDVCTLKDAICSNAARICDIARELGGDPWADGKCASAKASCKEARARCCRCAEGEPPADDDAAADREPPAGGEPAEP